VKLLERGSGGGAAFGVGDLGGLRGQTGTTIVELLVVSALGLLVVLAGVQLLKTHAALALQVQADVGASGDAAWALRTTLHDIRHAGADPLRRGIAAFAMARPDVVITQRDLDGDGLVDPRSEERVEVGWTDAGGGRLTRRVGAQAMAVVSGVSVGGFRLRYYDGDGVELVASGGLRKEDRARIRRVEIDLEVVERIGTVTGLASLAGSASVRVREGRR